MNDRIKGIFTTVILLAFIIGIMLINIFKAPSEISKSERRKLNQFPEITLASVWDTSFMKDFEKYALDQFIGRDFFRKIKAKFMYDVLKQKDNNGIYIVDGQVSKYNKQLNEEAIKDAGKKFNKVSKQFLKNMNVYYSVIPDKNYFLAKENGYPAIDYNVLLNNLNSSTKNMAYIDIFNELTIDDYYTTDTHWKQENIENVVNKLANAMNFSEYLNGTYEKVEKGDFYGVYYGQAALPLKPDTISYLTNDIIKNAKVKIFDSESMKMVDATMYNEEKLSGNDAYDLFLDGAVPLITIENENCNRNKELYIFRDSYGSSLTPLLTEAYSKITVIDLRYIATPLLKNFVEFNENADALFIYCVDVLNNSSILKVL